MKKYILLLLFALTAAGISAQNLEQKLSLGVHFGLLSGQAEEIVYRNEKSSFMLSQLLWNMDILSYAGIDLHYNLQKPASRLGFFTDAFFKFGIPGTSGVMEDRDWLDLTYPYWLTHYSVHDNKTERAIIIDVNAGLLIKVHNLFSIKPFLSYSYMNFSWTAKGGSFLYPDGHAYLISNMDVGTYEQTWNIISLGISLNGVFNRFFNVDLSLKFSPVVWCTAVDNHIMKDWIITEKMFGGFFIEPRLLFSFTPNDFFTLSLSMTYKEIFDTRGDSVYIKEGQIDPNIPKNIGGAGYFSSEFGIVASFAIIRSRASGGGGYK